MMLLSGCGSGKETSQCSWAKALYISQYDILTEITMRGILLHNETWEANCRK